MRLSSVAPLAATLAVAASVTHTSYSYYVPAQQSKSLRDAATSPLRPPHIVVIVSDDAGYGDFGCYGGSEIPTPAIDQLAASGVRFTQSYVTASVCCPSRAGLLTGRYQQRFGHEFNNPHKPEPGFTQADMGLDLDEQTIGDHLQELGYRTACIGKWHMGIEEHHDPTNRGFDESFGIRGGSRSYWSSKKIKGGGHALRANGEIVPERRISYLTDEFTDAAVDFIDRTLEAEDEPLFLYLAYTAPHTPMHAKPDDLAHFEKIRHTKRRIYAAMTKALDDGIAKVRATLQRHEVLDETLIVFINDNGGATNNGSDNGAMRGMKGSKWEGGIRVPMILAWPAGDVPPETVYDRPVSALDVLPTAVRAAGGDPASNLDGVDLVPFVAGRDKGYPHETLFWRRGVAAACRKGDWKLIRSDGNPDLLFNLADDPREMKNLASQHPVKVAELRTDLSDWEGELEPPRWKEGAKWERFQKLKHRMEVVGREMERKYP